MRYSFTSGIALEFFFLLISGSFLAAYLHRDGFIFHLPLHSFALILLLLRCCFLALFVSFVHLALARSFCIFAGERRGRVHVWKS